MIVEQALVHRLAFPLVVGTPKCLGGFAGKRVDRLQREVARHILELPRRNVLFLELWQRLTDVSATEGSLVVGEFDERQVLLGLLPECYHERVRDHTRRLLPAQQLEVVISPKGGTVEGTVNDRDERAMPNALLVLVPDAARARRHSLYETAITDQSGHFQLRGIEPGDYTVYAWDDIEDDAWFDAEAMKQYREDGAALTVRSGEKSHLEVRLTRNQPQQEAK